MKFPLDYELKPLSEVGYKYIQPLFGLTKVHSEESGGVKLRGKDVRLAVIEHNFNREHEAFRGTNISVHDCSGENRDHGTTVLGIAIGQEFANFPGGMAPDASVSVFGITDYESFLAALRSISSGNYDVVCFPYGGDSPPLKSVDDDIRREIRNLSKNTSIFAAAGNDGNQLPLTYPACLPEVISVGSLHVNAKLARNARKKGVDVYCYGDGVVVPCRSGRELKVGHGSSIATAVAAGLACLAIQCAKQYGNTTLFYVDKMKAMLNEKMRARGEEHAFDTSAEFLVKAFQDRRALEAL